MQAFCTAVQLTGGQSSGVRISVAVGGAARAPLCARAPPASRQKTARRSVAQRWKTPACWPPVRVVDGSDAMSVSLTDASRTC
jgi:hypothetical protein